jgi:hypothetical protein
VLVHDGNVHLSGTIVDERARQGIRVLVENVPGVRAIHDHMSGSNRSPGWRSLRLKTRRSTQRRGDHHIEVNLALIYATAPSSVTSFG